MDRQRNAKKRLDLAVFTINVAIVLGAGVFLVSQDAAFRRRERVETLRDNRFLTAEWRLMRELKERTDRELREKDREIAELRLRYLSYLKSGSSLELLASIKEEMRRAEAERDSILSARLKAATVPPAPGASGSGTAATAPAAAAPAATAPPRKEAGAVGGETPLSELLRRRIEDLEISVAASRAKAAAVETELEELRREDSRSLPPLAASPERPSRETAQDASVAQPVPSGSGGEQERLAAAVMDELARERGALDDPDGVLSLSDLKTRALLRAIVRTPAIRAEYPDLLESLDRYLSLSGKAEYLRGKSEAFDEVMAMVAAIEPGHD